MQNEDPKLYSMTLVRISLPTCPELQSNNREHAASWLLEWSCFMFCCLVHKERTPILTSPNNSLKCFCQENEKETLQTIEGALNDLLKFKMYSSKTCS